MMQIKIDPEIIELIAPDVYGVCRVAYRGVVIPGMYRTPETGAGQHTQRYYIAGDIQDRIERMSNHQQLEFYAATKGKP